MLLARSGLHHGALWPALLTVNLVSAQGKACLRCKCRITVQSGFLFLLTTALRPLCHTFVCGLGGGCVTGFGFLTLGETEGVCTVANSVWIKWGLCAGHYFGDDMQWVWDKIWLKFSIILQNILAFTPTALHCIGNIKGNNICKLLSTQSSQAPSFNCYCLALLVICG